MALPKVKPGGEFTYADYLTWPEDERWELIDGVAYAMSPAPTNSHQLIVGNLFARLHAHFKGKPCRPFVAPFDVRLPKAGLADQEVDTVLQPDITVVCAAEKLKDNRGCLGTPDWVIEVVSPSTALRDQKLKRAVYERHRVPEYWLVHPTDRCVTIYRLGPQGYGQPLIHGLGECCAPEAFPDLVIEVADIFADLPPIDDAASFY
ncbi:MAG: Uma2 family endonuclease [Pseudomonadota bacterium]|jgi:Uma2 family endonuclease